MARSLGRGSKASLEVLPELRVVVFSPVAERVRWMEGELARSATPTIVAHSVAQVVNLLVGTIAGLRPRLAVIDLDPISAGDLFHLHQIRERGWTGTLIALGRVPASLRISLGIDRAVAPPYAEDVLGEELASHTYDSQAATTPIPLPL